MKKLKVKKMIIFKLSYFHKLVGVAYKNKLASVTSH